MASSKELTLRRKNSGIVSYKNPFKTHLNSTHSVWGAVPLKLQCLALSEAAEDNYPSQKTMWSQFASF